MTIEEILENKPTHPENKDYYHISIIIMAIEEYVSLFSKEKLPVALGTEEIADGIIMDIVEGDVNNDAYNEIKAKVVKWLQLCAPNSALAANT